MCNSFRQQRTRPRKAFPGEWRDTARLETLIALGRKPQLVPEHKIEDGVNAVHMLFPRAWFDEAKCAPGLEALRQHRVDCDEKTRAFKKTAKEDWRATRSNTRRSRPMARRGHNSCGGSLPKT
jgi:hypothetical protein